MLDEWRDMSVREVYVDVPLTRGAHTIMLDYYEKLGIAQIRLRWDRLGTVIFPEWKGEYWSNLNFAGNPVLVRNDPAIDFNWGNGSPAYGIPPDGFSVRWTRTMTFQPGLYRLFALSDDGMRVFVDGSTVIDEWHDNASNVPYAVDLSLVGTHTFTVEYFERVGGAVARFWWQQLVAFPTVDPDRRRDAYSNSHSDGYCITDADAVITLTPSPTVTPTATATATASPTVRHRQQARRRRQLRRRRLRQPRHRRTRRPQLPRRPHRQR